MIIYNLLSLLLLLPLIRTTPTYFYESCSASTSTQILDYFRNENELLCQRRHRENLIAFTYNTNVTESNRLEMIEIASINAKEQKKLAERIKELGYDKVSDACISRQAKNLADIGYAVLSDQDYLDLQNAISSMQSNYAKVKVCSYTNTSDCSLNLEPDIQERLTNSRDPKELAYYWNAWHDAAGKPVKNQFAKYVELGRKAAKLNNYTSVADYWIHFYEDPKFEENLDSVYHALLPFYKELHGYVRYHLNKHYGDEVVPAQGNIPMHLLGNMWAQSWENSINLYKPFPEKKSADISLKMKENNFSIRKLFELGNEFFHSLGMRALPQTFWDRSVLERPTDREIVCHASAWDFYKNSDVRIKMCTEIDKHYYYVVHHELGHIQYYLQYEDQPCSLRTGANPGFHEAVGDVIALSVGSQKHLYQLGLVDSETLDEQSRINELFEMAVKKIVFLPFAYTLDKYRFGVFRGEISEPNWNCAFWRMRSQFTGVEPPNWRSREDFDPPAKYHIDADVEYLRYFAAHIFQFQFHKSLCILARQYDFGDPKLTLDNCDIYNNKRAGRAFAKFLSAGASQYWKVLLQELTGETTMNPDAILEYFAPLHKWLQEENKRLNVTLGWEMTSKVDANCEK